MYRADRRVERANGQPTPCRWCPKIPPDTSPKPENAVELSERNRRALNHYLECRAIGTFPDDPWVRRNAVVFRAIMDSVAEDRAEERENELILRLMSFAITMRAS